MSFSLVALGLYIRVPKEKLQKKRHLAGAAAAHDSKVAPTRAVWPPLETSCFKRGGGRASMRASILAAGAAMIYFGIQRGELATVFTKATRICLECIGLG